MKKHRDHYFHMAKREGYASRAIYKLAEIDRRRHLLRRGMRVVDLGSAPGSWLQYLSGRVGPTGRVVGVDLQPLERQFGANVRFVQADIFALGPAVVLEDETLFDLVLSDLAPNTTGIRSADASRSADLVLRALALATALLKPGGTLLAKVFQGSRNEELRHAFVSRFREITWEKPAASRKESVEIFLLGRGMW